MSSSDIVGFRVRLNLMEIFRLLLNSLAYSIPSFLRAVTYTWMKGDKQYFAWKYCVFGKRKFACARRDVARTKRKKLKDDGQSTCVQCSVEVIALASVASL